MSFYDDANDNASYILVAGNTSATAFNLSTEEHYQHCVPDWKKYLKMLI